MKDNTGLRLAVQALREAPPETADKFTMSWFAASCGTPGCVLGHLAARQDLQQKFELHRRWGSLVHQGEEIGLRELVLLEFFDITPQEAIELFDCEGCDNAQTRQDAIDYLEKFIASRECGA